MLRPSAPALLLVLAAACAAPAPAAEVLTLRDALAATLRHSPELDAATLAVREREALALQAGRWPNPELRLEAENIGGSGAFAGVESAESTLRLSQLVELGGKRPARVAGFSWALSSLALALRLAAAALPPPRVAPPPGARHAATAAVALRRAAVLARTAQAFIALLAAQEQRTLLARRRADAVATLDGVAALVRAGGAAPIDELRARLLRDETELLDRRRAAEQAAAEAELRALWGGAGPSFETVRGDLAAVAEPPDAAQLLRAVDDVPSLTLPAREIAAREAAVTLEEARAVPDMLFGAGPRYFSDTDDAALIVELTLPLPVFNRNRDAIAAARARVAAAEAEGRGARATLHAAVTTALAAQRGAWEQLVVLRERLLPAARDARAGTEAMYRRGALRLDEVQGAQRALFDLQAQEIELLATWHRAAAELDRLLGAAPAAVGANTEDR